MRTEQEMYTMIIDTAKADDRILAVYMNGSRVNPEAERDIFQDYAAAHQTRDFLGGFDCVYQCMERIYLRIDLHD